MVARKEQWLKYIHNRADNSSNGNMTKIDANN